MTMPMTMQRLCHVRTGMTLAGIIWLCSSTDAVRSDPVKHDYPTEARVEYVNDCITRSGGKLSNLYQCSCAIDRIAAALSYDDFVEASTYARYATLPGEAGGVFRDPEEGQKMAKLFRDTESRARRECGLDSKP